MKPYRYYCFVFFTFEIGQVGVEFPPLLWYSLYISCSNIVSMLPLYIHLKRFDLTVLGEKYPIKANLLSFEVITLPCSCHQFLTILLKDCFKITLSPSAAQIGL